MAGAHDRVCDAPGTGRIGRDGTQVVNGWTVPGFTHSQELGGGTAGRVVLAVDDVTQTQVAIKYLDARLDGDEAFMSRFRLVARRLSQLEDPNVVDFFDFVESPNGTAIVMERAEGVTLRRVLAAKGPTGPLAALSALGGVLLGLAAAHERDIVHGAVRPANIMIDPTGDEHGGGLPAGNTRLTDFALAPAGAEAANGPAYAAPELWDGGAATVASDLYAATAVFFECLTGRPPFTGRSQSALAKAHREAPIPVDGVPGPLHDLINQGLAKDPEKRPASAADFLGMVEDAAVEAYGPAWEAQGRGRLVELAREAAKAPEPKPSRSSGRTAVRPASAPARGGRRGRVLVAAAAVLLVGGGVAGAATLLNGDRKGDGVATRPATSGVPEPVRTPAVPPEATALAQQIEQATAGTPSVSFALNGSGLGGPLRANGMLASAAGAPGSYSMSLAGARETRKSARTVLVQDTLYLKMGKRWRQVPVAGQQRGYAALASQVRAATAPAHVLTLLKSATTFGKGKIVYHGTAPVGAVPALGDLARQTGAQQVEFVIRLDRANRPSAVKLTMGAKPRTRTLFTNYSGWSRKTVAAPRG
ncbi:serine/threonine-protein kinase [Actinomadura namibiensis]|uniref:non-specific serine/threonine protein kinase n=1 Tax=Actinomadura namibiensis TaxID=182080 RepID=A0A7W3LTM6_ACTNM|nr:serine/threonine-protein kinase [Actinomadura namibiensis]MBA8954054.1 tRNA A-37 threonylcarbamoyl transferase component Bud32 [Actinomadura namibiensis]